MLVLTRKQNEKIQIGENITITVLRMKGKGVRLGIQAPGEMNVLRGELVFEAAEEPAVEIVPVEASGWSDDSPSEELAAASTQVGWTI